MKKTLPAIALLAVFTTITASADQGTVIHFNSSTAGMPNKLSILNGSVLIPSPNDGGRIIMDTNKNVMLMINDPQKQYMEMSQKTIEQSSGIMAQMKEQMAAQLQALPEEQRKAIEQRMGLNLAEPAAPKIEVKATGKKRKVSGIECEERNVLTNGQATLSTCVATPEASGINMGDYKTMKKMFHFSREMARKSGGIGGGLAANIPDLDGVPMEVKDLQSGNTLTISSIKSEDLDSKTFKPDPSYTRFDPIQQMQQQMQRMPARAPAGQ